MPRAKAACRSGSCSTPGFVAGTALLDDDAELQQVLQLAADRLPGNAGRAGNRRGVHGPLAFHADDAVEGAMLRAEEGIAHARLDAGRADDLGDARQVEIPEIDGAPFALDAVKVVADHVDEETRVRAALRENQPSLGRDRRGASPRHSNLAAAVWRRCRMGTSGHSVSPSVLQCSVLQRTYCSFWAVRRLKASRPGLGCGRTGGWRLRASMDCLRKARRGAGPIGLALLVLAGSPAHAQWNYYDNSSNSFYVPFVPGLSSDFRYVKLSVNNGTGPQTTTNFVMDTGSLGIVAGSNYFNPGPGDIALGTGSITYTTSGTAQLGTLYLSTVTINGLNGQTATTRVPVLQSGTTTSQMGVG